MRPNSGNRKVNRGSRAANESLHPTSKGRGEISLILSNDDRIDAHFGVRPRISTHEVHSSRFVHFTVTTRDEDSRGCWVSDKNVACVTVHRGSASTRWW